MTLLQANHSQLLLGDEDNGEMDRLKNHIDTLLDEQEKKRPSSTQEGMLSSSRWELYLSRYTMEYSYTVYWTELFGSYRNHKMIGPLSIWELFRTLLCLEQTLVLL